MLIFWKLTVITSPVGSVTSSDSSSTGSYHHHTLYEIDSGHATSIDSHSSSSLGSSNSPPQQRNQHMGNFIFYLVDCAKVIILCIHVPILLSRNWIFQ